MQDPTNIAISIKDLTVAYDEKPALWDIDLNIPKGALTAIIGPNGAGKTSLIKATLGIIKPIAGRVDIFGQPMNRQRSQVAYVPQRNSVDWDSYQCFRCSYDGNILEFRLVPTTRKT